MTNENETTAHRWRAPASVAILVAVSALAATAGGASAGTLGLPDSATTQGDGVAELWVIFGVLAALVTLLIWGLTTYVIVSSLRRRRHAPSSSRSTSTTAPSAGAASTGGVERRPPPRQHQYNTRLEIIYTAIPLVLVVVLVSLALRTTATLTATTADPALDVNVTGFQWQWQFAYPQQRITVAAGGQDDYPTLVLPVGRTVRFRLVANDVIHSFWVPEFLEKRDLIPGVDNVIEVFVKAPGEWTGRCAEYCGFNHWRMKFTVRAVPADEFDRWVVDAAAKPQPIVDTASRGTSRVAGGVR